MDSLLFGGFAVINEDLVKAYQNGDKQAMGQIVENNRGLVFMVVNRHLNSLETSYLEKDDLEQLGFIGLMEAVKGFDPSKGFKFTSYASTAILGHITRGLRVSTPWEKRSSSDSRMCKVVSAHERVPGTDDITYLDAIDDPDAQFAYDDMIDQVDQEILKKEVRITMNRVFSPDDREGQAIVMRYGLNDYSEHTLREIGSALNVSIERSRGLVNKGIRRIRQSKAGHELKRKYLVEFGIAPRREKLTRMEYKNPVEYLKQLEQWRQELLECMR